MSLLRIPGQHRPTGAGEPPGPGGITRCQGAPAPL